VDSITQAALGAVVGELVLGKKIGWKASAWGLFFGTLPDLDVLVSPFLDEVTRLHWHRGISHSIFMMIVATIVLAKPLSRIHRKAGVTTKEAGGFVFLAWSTHVLIDVFTTYGTQILEPFSDRRFALNNFFIIDPLFTLPLLGCCLAVALRCLRVLMGKSETTAIPSAAASRALVLSGTYLAFSLVMKLWAVGSISDLAAKELTDAKVIAVAPTPLNTILWRALIETDEGYFVKFWSPFDSEETGYDYFAKNHYLAEPFENEKLFEALQWFSRGHWVARRSPEGKIIFIDMRFGEMRNREHQVLLPMFQWHLSYDAEGNFQAPSYRPRDLDVRGALQLIWLRLRGHTSEWEGMKAF